MEIIRTLLKKKIYSHAWYSGKSFHNSIIRILSHDLSFQYAMIVAMASRKFLRHISIEKDDRRLAIAGVLKECRSFIDRQREELAEREGFEPPVPQAVQLISSPILSTST